MELQQRAAGQVDLREESEKVPEEEDAVEAVFTTSRYGKPVIQIGKHRFNKWSGSKGPRARWQCVKTCYGFGRPEFIPTFTVSRYGKPVIEIGPFRFNKKECGDRRRAHWRCVKGPTTKCRAKVITMDNEIVFQYNTHNHAVGDFPH
ncbi:unnamed protein product [Chilo suppressalis]|uniref:FLYWCH-type domain-containing protein n=1 Tax=Chilo suppressalis TaxID=168631 RepID=A0ABN8AZU2_CHISP|nr:unnamed protein product [Chilo suppressalis]